ncbi:MAG: hypothetical protein PHV23_05950 [Candidatus Gracilibacteria bacterium]|nr:hypothetical protein [Candidatus Gracilibacteria bacterium]
MEKLTSKEKNKPITGLSKKVQNYSKAIVFSVAAILGAQSSDTIADNLLSDSTLQISKPQKETPESIRNNENFVNTLSDFIIKFGYENIENKKGLIEAIKQKLADNCDKSGKKCDINKYMDFFKEDEKVIISYFKDVITKDYDTLTINLNIANLSKMLDLLPYIETIFIARYGENYMEVLTKENIDSGAYDLEISINIIDGEYKITNMKLLKKEN